MENVLERYALVIREIDRVNAAIVERSMSPAADGDTGPVPEPAQHHLLLVDDDERIRSVVGEILRGHGYSVDTVADGSESLRKLEDDPSVEVVLLDISMPGMGGLEVLRFLKYRERRPGVIMLTSVEDAETARDSIEQGAFDYVVKSANPEELAASIAACLHHLEYEKQPWWKRLF
jgi:DNA-binding response OmpR family regulator